MKDKIEKLEENLQVKSSQIILTEKIARYQLKNADNIIQHLKQDNSKQVINIQFFISTFSL